MCRYIWNWHWFKEFETELKIIQTNVENNTKNVSNAIRNCILDVYVTSFNNLKGFLHSSTVLNFGKALDDDPKQRYVMPKNAQEELEFLMTLVQAFESDLLVSWMKSKPSKPVSEELDFGAFTQEAWIKIKLG